MTEEHVTRFAYDPDSPAQRRATALAMTDQEFKADLAQHRRDLGLSQEEVARRMGVAQPTVSEFERYDNDPKLSTIRRYAHAVGLLIEHAVRVDHGLERTGWRRQPVCDIVIAEPRTASTAVPHGAFKHFGRTDLDLAS